MKTKEIKVNYLIERHPQVWNVAQIVLGGLLSIKMKSSPTFWNLIEICNLIVCVLTLGYGMFTNIEESQSVWLKSSSLESEKEFELVGILLGLAIYNGIILDVRFPLVIYKKLQGEKLDLQDLMSVQPSLAKSLMELLEFDGDVEDTFCYTFQVSCNSYC